MAHSDRLVQTRTPLTRPRDTVQLASVTLLTSAAARSWHLHTRRIRRLCSGPPAPPHVGYLSAFRTPRGCKTTRLICASRLLSDVPEARHECDCHCKIDGHRHDSGTSVAARCFTTRTQPTSAAQTVETELRALSLLQPSSASGVPTT